MIKNYSKIILPNKKINITVIMVLFLGIVMGSVFANIIGLNDKILVSDKIKLFIDNVNGNTINSLIVFKNSISINLIYIILISFFSLAILGIIINLFLLFTKGFIFGFSIASFILTYHYKGIVLSLLYLLFGQLLNIIVIIFITIYGMMISVQILKVLIRNNNTGIKKLLKNYLIIIVLSIIISLIAASGEAFLLPAIIKLLIKIFV